MEEGEAGGHGWEEQVGVWLGGRGEAGSILGLELQNATHFNARADPGQEVP